MNDHVPLQLTAITTTIILMLMSIKDAGEVAGRGGYNNKSNNDLQ